MHIQTRSFGNFSTKPAGVAGFIGRSMLTIEGFSHYSGQSGFASTANPAENHRMGNSLLSQGVLQGTDDGLLSDNFGKPLGPRFSGKDKVGQGRFQQLRIGGARHWGRQNNCPDGMPIKKDSRAPCTHKEGHYRCFLPDLTGFAVLYCAGPGYHTEIIFEKERTFE